MEDKERHSLEGMNVMHRIIICYIQNSLWVRREAQ